MPTLYQILKQSHKNGEKKLNNFVVEVSKKFDLDTDFQIHTNYQLSSSQIRCLQDRKSCQEMARIPPWTGNHSWFHVGVGMIKSYIHSLPSKFVWNTGHSRLRAVLSPYFLKLMEPRNRFQRMNSASLCSLAGWYDNPIPPRFLAPIDSLKIPALHEDTIMCEYKAPPLYYLTYGLPSLSFISILQALVCIQSDWSSTLLEEKNKNLIFVCFKYIHSGHCTVYTDWHKTGVGELAWLEV